MRISDWSADVCSSDLIGVVARAETETNTTPMARRFDLLWPTRFVAQTASLVVKQHVERLRLLLRCLHWYFRSEEHTSELQSLMRISYAVFCLKKKKTKIQQ